jgi:hypothetical protein
MRACFNAFSSRDPISASLEPKVRVSEYALSRRLDDLALRIEPGERDGAGAGRLEIVV